MTLKILVASILLATTCITATNAQAAVRHDLDIPAQELGSALVVLAKQAHLQVVYSADLVQGHSTRSLSGSMTPDEALDKLLATTGLKYEFLDEQTVTLSTLSSKGGESSRLPETRGGGRRAEEGTPSAGEEQRGFWSRFRLAQAETSSSSDGKKQTSEDSATNPQKRITLEEIIVSAQKRTEKLQDVPISISVLGGDQLDASTDRSVAEALNRVPGVISAISNAGARSNIISAIVVRGVAPVVGAGGSGGVTGYYLDSIPFGFIRRSDAPDSSAYDLDRVEVLRGPQGTLYGMNALNGVVRVLTKDADPDKFEFKGRGSGSSTKDGGGNYRGDMALNVPIIDGKLAARAVVGYQKFGGWIDKPIENDANDGEAGNYRLKLAARPTDKLSLDLTTWFSRSDYDASLVSTDNLTSGSLFEEPTSIDYDAYGFEVGYDFGRFTFSSMTSYIDFVALSSVDFAPFTAPGGLGDPLVFLNQLNSSKVFSEEVVLNSAGTGSWRWSVGSIYRDASEVIHQTRNNPITGALTSGYLAFGEDRTYSESLAVFGELTRAFDGGQFELTAGLRYFEDRVTDQLSSLRTVVGGIPVGGLVSSENKFDNISPRVVLAWHPADRTTLYASYSEGFRSGLNQLTGVTLVAPQFPPVQPDELTNYELGAKGSLWDGRINYDTAVYYIDWEGVQQQLVSLIPGTTNTLNALVNAGAVNGLGFEIAATGELLEGLTLGINFSRNDLEVEDDVFSGATQIFAPGDRLSLSPKYAAGATLDYAFPLTDTGFRGQISSAANYLPEVITDRVNATTVFESDSVLTSRASFSVISPTNWTLSLFVDNVTDRDDVTSRDRFTTAWNTHLRPRTIGLQFEYQY